MKNKIYIQYLWFAIFVLMATVVSSQQVDPAEDVTQISYRSVEPPDYYPTRTALTKNEMHVLDTLTAAERTFIESAYDPPAIGVVRDLTDPIRFSMEQNNFLTQDEISVSGGRLTRVTDDLLVFTTYFESKKADEIRIFFAEGNFPYGVEVNLFSRDDYAFNQPELVGELDEHGFYTTTTFADYLYLQVVIPLDKVNDNVSFAITRITHVDNRYIPDEINRDCFLDANCSNANSFTHIDGFRRATARLSWPTGGGLVGLCTGTLLNDMRTVDFQPFLLTANHCFSTQNDATGLEARFYYWSTECNSGVVNPNHIIVNGSNLIATNSQTDFTLVLLKQKGGNFYMGWSANSVANNTIMHSVHHPGGTLMKYHRMLNKTSPSWTCDGFSTSNFHYTKVTHGQSAGGSSGGGIVDPDGRIRGQLYGTCNKLEWDPCDYNTYYNMWGRFDVTYSNNNIQYWLANGGASVSMYVVNSINFGYVNVGNYNDYNLAIKNNGTRPNFLNLEINNAYITGTNSSHFSIIGSKILYLAPGETGYITVRYKPLESGSSVATLNLVHNADNYTTPRQVTLNGSSSPCSDIISLGGGGYANRKTFSKSGDGVWTTNVCGYNCNGREQIYSFVAPYTGYYSIEVVSTNNTWVDYFWKSGSCSSAGWNCIDFVYSPHVLGSMYWTAGTTYHILLDAEVTSQATHTFFVFYNPCANAIEIAGIGSGYSKTFAGGGQSAWNNTSVSACGYYCYGGERVYSFTAPTTGIYSIQVTSASGYVDYMWKAGICNSTGWECIDDISVPGKYGSMSWTAGTTYYILLDDENTTAGSHTFYINEPEIAGIWLGTTNSNWHTASNWTAGIIPDASIDVVIPGGTTYQPSVQSADAECNNLLLENGASLTIGGTYKLTVNIDANIKGSLIMNNTFSKLYVNRDVKWFAGSSANMTGNATIYLKRTWEFQEGANIALTTGFVDFFGSGNSYIRSNDANSYFNNIRNNKTGTALAHSAASNYPCRLNGNLYIYSNCKFTSYSTQKFIIGGFINNMSGAIELDSGTIEFGGGGGTSYFMPGDYFNNLVINSTGSVTFNNNMEVRGSLSIISGTLKLLSTTLNVKGNWTNSIFPAGFDAGNSRVRFTGPGHQYVTTSETFNILEVANGAALRVDASTSEVTCNQYDWTSGGIDVIKGTFTALDLAQNGIYGSYYVNPGGVINLEKINGWVDFNGHIYIFGGEFNIYGGTSDSYWPYQANASLTMSGGTLDFKDVGIVVYNSNSFTFTHDITGGTIRTIGGLTVYRSDFTPAGGVFEFYGSNDRFISVATGSQLQHVTINKSGKAATTAIPEEPLYDERSGMMLGDGSRANNITLDTDVTILGNLNITAGSLTINGKTLTVKNDCFIYGTLNMTNASDVFNAGTQFYHWLEFKSGSTANITDGTINCYGWIIPLEGSNFNLGLNNTVYIKGANSGGGITNYEPTATYGKVVIQKESGAKSYIDSYATQPIIINGSFTISDNNELYIQGRTMTVNGGFSDTPTSKISLAGSSKSAFVGVNTSGTFPDNTTFSDGLLTINSDYYINGLLDVADGNTLLTEGFGINLTGVLKIDGGSFINNRPDISDWTLIKGSLQLSDGLFELTYGHPNFLAGSSSIISGGTIRIGGAFAAVGLDVFKPSGGLVDITGSNENCVVYCYGGNYFHNLSVNRTGQYSIFMNGYPVEVNNNFTVNKGEIRTAYSLVKILGNLEINNGGNLTVNSGGGIAMGASRSITINNGGKIELNGVLSNPALVTRISSGNYAFNIESGGTIAAEYGLFEHMNSGGINIKSGAIVDPDHSFNNSTFRNGASGGRLLTVNNNQNFTVNNAIFPSNTWGGTYNVYKNINSGIVTFSNATGAFSGSAHEYDPYNRIFWGDEPLVHTIQVPAGWSGLSSYIMPLNTDITEIFSPVFSDFIMAQTMSSAYYPAGGINTIVNWQSQSAYKVKMVQEAFLPISGDEETNKTLALSVGWSLVPVICNTPVSASSIFSGSGFTLAKDVAGVGVYWPSMGINTLGNLLPGRAYYAYCSSPKNITFPPNSKQSWAGYYPTIPVINHPWNDVEVSGSSHLIAIQVESCKGLLPGDVIGVFSPDQLCFGVVEISDLQNNALLIAWADDPLTAEKDGFEEMDLMNYKLYRPQSGELFDLDVEYDQDLPQTGYFYGEGLSAIKTFKMTSLGSYEALASIVSLYPNPTTGIIWAKGIKDFTKIEIYNSIGNCIKTFVNQSDDNLEIDLSVHSSGVYHIKFIGKESSIIKRVVKK